MNIDINNLSEEHKELFAKSSDEEKLAGLVEGARKEVADTIRSLRNSKLYTREEIKSLVKNIKEAVVGAITAAIEEIGRSTKEQSTTEEFITEYAEPGGQAQTTNAGLPKTDTVTPKNKKTPKAKQKKSFGQRLKSASIAALRMNPLIAAYMDTIDEVNNNSKRKELEERIHDKFLESNIDPTSAKGEVASKEIVKLLERIEINTRGETSFPTGLREDADTKNPTTKVEAFKTLLKDSTNAILSQSSLGRGLMNTYAFSKSGYEAGKEKMKSWQGVSKETLNEAGKETPKNWEEAGGLKGFVHRTKDTTTNSSLSKFATKLLNRADKNIQDSKFGQNYLGAQWWAKDKMREGKNFLNSSVSNVNKKLSTLNPFTKTAEEKTEEEMMKKDQSSGLLTKIAANTLETAKSGGKGLMKMLSGIFIFIKPLLAKLLPILATLTGPILALAGAAGAAVAGKMVGDKIKGGLDSVTQNITGDKDDTLGTGIYRGIDKIKGVFGSSDEDKIHNAEKASELAYYEKAKKEGRPISAQLANKLKARGVQVDPAMIVSKSEPAPKTLATVPESIDKAATNKEALDNKISSNAQASAIAPIINSPITNVSTNNNTMSIRTHPKNQESTWRNYIEHRYAN